MSSPLVLLPVDIRISRIAPLHFGMPEVCPRRVCRRTGYCPAPLSADGEPACIGALHRYDRRLFASQRCLAIDCTAQFFHWKPLPEPVTEEEAFLLGFAIGIAGMALAVDTAQRPRLRAWLRRIHLPPAGPPPEDLALGFEWFGRVFEDDGIDEIA